MTSFRLYKRFARIEITNKQNFVKTFENLRVTFKIEKTSESSPDKSHIKIYNLNSTSRAFCEIDQPGDIKVQLFVGYENFAEKIFSGDVRKSTSVHQFPEWITELECGDGEEELSTATVDQSYAAGTPMTAILNQVLEALGLDKGVQTLTDLTGKITINGESVSGKAKDVIDNLAARYGFEWRVQDNAVQINPKAQAVETEAIAISARTGLISDVIKRGKDGLEFKSLIIPTLAPGKLVEVNARLDNGFFKVRKVTFSGDTAGEDWYATCECAFLGQSPGGAVQAL